MRTARQPSRGTHPGLIFALAFVVLLALHAPLLRLPYFWDEAGYYIPAARDLLLSGSAIPHSTPSNAHPPLVMAYLALWWKIAGFAPVVTRTAMLLVASFSLLGLFRLAEKVANREVAVGATICTALYPVFFAQSSLAHLDLAAAGLTFWGLSAYVRGRAWQTALWFALAALAKETAILAPIALLAWELLSRRVRLGDGNQRRPAFLPHVLNPIALLLPLLPLTAWYAYHYSRTGLVFGNPEFFRYNVEGTLQPLRIVLACLIRLWQTFGYLHLLFLTLAAMFAMRLPPLQTRNEAGNQERPRIALNTQFAMLSVIVAYVLAMAIVGGAVLARYMLPVVPLVILIGVSTLWRRVPWWGSVVAIIALTFVAAWFVNPPYGFAPEDNLAYVDYIRLHQHAEDFVEARHPMARVLTAWPASDELTRPYLGYVTRPMRVVRIEHFALEELMAAADFRSEFEIALVFSTKYEPAHPLLENSRLWQSWKTRFFGYHRDTPPAAAAQILGGTLVYTETRNGQWIGVIEMAQVIDATIHVGTAADQLSSAAKLRSCSGKSVLEKETSNYCCCVGWTGGGLCCPPKELTPVAFPDEEGPCCRGAATCNAG